MRLKTYQLQRLQFDDPENDTALTELLDRVKKSLPKGDKAQPPEAAIEQPSDSQYRSSCEAFFVIYHTQRSANRLRNILARLYQAEPENPANLSAYRDGRAREEKYLPGGVRENGKERRGELCSRPSM